MFHKALTGDWLVLWTKVLRPNEQQWHERSCIAVAEEISSGSEKSSKTPQTLLSWRMLLLSCQEPQSWPGRKRVKRMEETENCSGKSPSLSECPVNVPTDFSIVRISPHAFCRKPFPSTPYAYLQPAATEQKKRRSNPSRKQNLRCSVAFLFFISPYLGKKKGKYLRCHFKSQKYGLMLPRRLELLVLFRPFCKWLCLWKNLSDPWGKQWVSAVSLGKLWKSGLQAHFPEKGQD